jgi:hypothetical protein
MHNFSKPKSAIEWIMNYRRIYPAAGELSMALTHFMKLMAQKHLGHELQRRLDHPAPEDIDRETLKSMHIDLRKDLSFLTFETGENNEQLLNLVYSLRIFLDATDSLTGWRSDFA